jgi:hypothetical protein
MTEFKPGDRVRHTMQRWPGTVRDVTYANSPLVDWDTPYDVVGASYVNRGNLEFLSEAFESTRPLVGPAPKVESPHFVAPFKGIRRYVVDAEGDNVLEIPDEVGGIHAEEFAAYVAAALNARVFGEE